MSTDRWAAWDWDTAESIPALAAGDDPCEICDRTPATKCPDCGLLLCQADRESDEHREYCRAVRAAGGEESSDG